MRVLTFITALAATTFATASSLDTSVGEVVERAELWSYNTPAPTTNSSNIYDDSAPNGVKILPRFANTPPKDGATRTTIKYGSYSVSKANMMSTFKLVKGPCPWSGCYVTAMEATIRFPDGREANIVDGAWLHHIAMFGSGGGQGSLWAAGNERPTIRLNTEHKFGLDFPQMYMLMIDLMTETVKPLDLTLEVTFEWVPKERKDYKPAAMYWLTIGEPAAKEGKFDFKTWATKSGYNAKLLYAIGHMHDGGSDMQLFVNDKLVCKSIMHYNARPGYMESQAVIQQAGGKQNLRFTLHGPEEEMEGMDHISDPGACTNFGELKYGDTLTAQANYDATAHGLMVHNGKKEALMGNMRVYIGPE